MKRILAYVAVVSIFLSAFTSCEKDNAMSVQSQEQTLSGEKEDGGKAGEAVAESSAVSVTAMLTSMTSGQDKQNVSADRVGRVNIVADKLSESQIPAGAFPKSIYLSAYKSAESGVGECLLDRETVSHKGGGKYNSEKKIDQKGAKWYAVSASDKIDKESIDYTHGGSFTYKCDGGAAEQIYAGTSDDAAKLVLNPLLAAFTVKVVNPRIDYKITKLTLSNVITSGSYSFADGWNASGSAQTISYTKSGVDIKAGKDADFGTLYLIPQKLSGTVSIEFEYTLSDSHETYLMSKKISVGAGGLTLKPGAATEIDINVFAAGPIIEYDIVPVKGERAYLPGLDFDPYVGNESRRIMIEWGEKNVFYDRILDSCESYYTIYGDSEPKHVRIYMNEPVDATGTSSFFVPVDSQKTYKQVKITNMSIWWGVSSIGDTMGNRSFEFAGNGDEGNAESTLVLGPSVKRVYANGLYGNNFNVIRCYSKAAPTITDRSFNWSVKNGRLEHYESTDFSSWMKNDGSSTSEGLWWGYFGYLGWTERTF